MIRLALCCGLALMIWPNVLEPTGVAQAIMLYTSCTQALLLANLALYPEIKSGLLDLLLSSSTDLVSAVPNQGSQRRMQPVGCNSSAERCTLSCELGFSSVACQNFVDFRVLLFTIAFS